MIILSFGRRRIILWVLFLLLYVWQITGCSLKPLLPPADKDNGGLFLPEGFEALTVVDSLGRARHLAVNTNGDIYVRFSSSDTVHGGNVALRDTNQDGKADIIQRFGGEGARRTSYGTEMKIHNGYLYLSTALELFRYRLTPGALVPQGERETVLRDDHEHGAHWHITKPVAFDNQGFMYIPFGTPSNACQDITATPNGASGGVGLDPCPELEHHGGIWRFEADKINLTQRDGVRMATGIRSVVGIEWNPMDEAVYIVMHGRDNLYSLFPDRYNAWQSAVLPAEELIKIKKGADYGWPYCYYDQMQGKNVLAPEYGGDGNLTERCTDTDLPAMGFPGHWAPNDLLFYQGEQFPSRYREGVFIAFHGSTNRIPYPQAGYFVSFVPFKNGQPDGTWEVFADGFAGVDTVVNTRDARFRPVGLAEGPDGSLYISDSRKGRIWRVMYKGEKSSFGEKQLAKMEERKALPHLKTPDIVRDDLQKSLSAGEKLYNTFCGTCHQKDGKGVPGRFPPLTPNPFIRDSKKLTEIALHGLSGSVEIDGEVYDGVMPPHNFLSDQDLASILTFIRGNFGNQLPEVTQEYIRENRGQ